MSSSRNFSQDTIDVDAARRISRARENGNLIRGERMRMAGLAYLHTVRALNHLEDGRPDLCLADLKNFKKVLEDLGTSLPQRTK